MKRFKNILASVDTRRDTHPALEWAAGLARDNAAQLKLVDVMPEFSWPVRLALPNHQHTRELLIQEKRERLEALAAPLRAEGLEVTTAALSGKTSVEIIREVLRANHDLVVRVSKGAESRREGYFGNTTTRLLRNCPCPVWVVKPDAPPRFLNVLSAVDPAPHDDEHTQLNKTVMELGRSIAARVGGEFHVLHIWSLFGESALASHLSAEEFAEVDAAARAHVNRAYDNFLADYGMSLADPCVHLVKGEPPRALPAFVAEHQIDLLVLGTVGRSGVSALVMGNTAEAVLNQVHCALLAVKPEGFVSHITL